MSTSYRKLRVFLCHASQDKPVVRELYKRLHAEGWIDPWLDEEKLLPGQDWNLEIEKSVENSDVVIACLSNTSVNKEGFVQREIRYAVSVALDKPDDTIFVVPLLLETCDVPRSIQKFHWVEYFGEKKDEKYKALLLALGVRRDQIAKRELIEQNKKEAEERTRLEAENRIKYEKEHVTGKTVKKPDRQIISYAGINEVNTKLFKTYYLIEAIGRIDRSNSVKLADAFESAYNAGKFKILVDMSRLEYMSSGGFRVLLSAQRNCKRFNRGEVILVKAPDRFREALDLAGLSDSFRLFDDSFEAAGSF